MTLKKNLLSPTKKTALLMAFCLCFASQPKASSQDINPIDRLMGKSAHEQAQILTPVGSPFTQALTLEYRRFMEPEQAEGLSYLTANVLTSFMAEKAVETAQGVMVPPENPNKWSVSPLNLPELIKARARLDFALQNGAREQSPIEAAKAQAAYDCWVRDAAEGVITSLENACKERFKSAASAVETSGLKTLDQDLGDFDQDYERVAESTERYDPTMKYRADDSASEGFIPRYMIFFRSGGASLDQQGRDVIDLVVRKYRSMKPQTIEVFGFSDRSGPEAANIRVSQKRADSVRDALIKRGVPENRIATKAMGERYGLVKTADGVSEPGNRRVEILFRR